MKKNVLIPLIIALGLCGCKSTETSNSDDTKTTTNSASSETTETSSNITSDTTSESSTTEEVEPLTDEEYLAQNDEDYKKNFVPILRVAVASDLHIHDNDTETSSYYKKAVKVCTTSYSEAAKSTQYKNVDAIMIAGDMVDNGKVTQYRKVKAIFSSNMKKGTKLITTCGNHDFWDDRQNTIDNYLSVFADQDADQRVIANGFDFISFVPSPNNALDGATFESSKISWLRQQLSDSASEHPNQPIFVMTHYPEAETVYGSYDSHWITRTLDDVFKDYPQVVYVSGHSHAPIADPRSLYQKDYTCINAGTTSYSTHQINGFTGYDTFVYPSDRGGSYVSKSNYLGDPYEAGDLQLVEVDKFGALRIKGYDLLTDTHIFTRLVRDTLDKTKFVTNEMKLEQSVAPEFEEGAIVKNDSITKNSGRFIFNVSTSEEYVESYRVQLYSEDGEFIKTTYLLGDEFLWPNPTKLRAMISGLESATTYKLKIYAVNAYNKISTKPIEHTFTTK